jgi:hypothetical protein
VARELGVSERTVYRKLREFGLRALTCGIVLPLSELIGDPGFLAFLA